MTGEAETGGAQAGGARWSSPLRMLVWGGAKVLMLIPAVAVQLTEEVAWNAFDFILWGAMLLAACGAYELAARMSGDLGYRIGACLGIGGGFLLVWINLAVGIIGGEDNPANLMYFGILLMGIAGAVLARFKPLGMARTLWSMAVGTVAIGAVALLAGWGSEGENWPQVIVVLNAFFAGVWLASGWLFRRAAGQRP